MKPLGLSRNGTKGIIDVCKGLPLNGSYWVVPEGFEGNFSQSPELITGGILPKAWRYMEHDGIYLYKGGTTGVSNTGRNRTVSIMPKPCVQTLCILTGRTGKGSRRLNCALFTRIDTAYSPIGSIVRAGENCRLPCLLWTGETEFSEQLCRMIRFRFKRHPSRIWWLGI